MWLTAWSTFRSPITRHCAFPVRSRGYDPLTKDVFTSAGQDGGLFEGGFRAKYLWAKGSFRVLISADYTHEKGIASEALTFRSQTPGSIASANALVGITPSPTNVDNASNAPSTEHLDVWGLQANVSYTLGNGDSIIDILAFRRYYQYRLLDADYTQINIADELLNNPLRYSQLSNELRYASATGRRLEYQVGIYYDYATNDVGDIVEAGDLGLGVLPRLHRLVWDRGPPRRAYGKHRRVWASDVPCVR